MLTSDCLIVGRRPSGRRRFRPPRRPTLHLAERGIGLHWLDLDTLVFRHSPSKLLPRFGEFLRLLGRHDAVRQGVHVSEFAAAGEEGGDGVG